MPRRIGITRTWLSGPFADALVRRAGSGVVLVDYPPQQLAEELRQGNLDGAFVSPHAYVSCYPTHRIVAGTGIVSEGASGLVALLYREHARTMSRIAAPTGTPAERALAQIVLMEKYDTRPVFEELAGPWEEALQSADAVLVTDTLARATAARQEKLDLVDEWEDMTELPFVHGFWVVRDDAYAEWSPFAPPEEAIAPMIRTAPAAEDWNGLREFYRMAYYHGIINDLPDLRFTASDEERP